MAFTENTCPIVAGAWAINWPYTAVPIYCSTNLNDYNCQNTCDYYMVLPGYSIIVLNWSGTSASDYTTVLTIDNRYGTAISYGALSSVNSDDLIYLYYNHDLIPFTDIYNKTQPLSLTPSWSNQSQKLISTNSYFLSMSICPYTINGFNAIPGVYMVCWDASFPIFGSINLSVVNMQGAAAYYLVRPKYKIVLFNDTVSSSATINDTLGITIDNTTDTIIKAEDINGTDKYIKVYYNGTLLCNQFGSPNFY